MAIDAWPKAADRTGRRGSVSCDGGHEARDLFGFLALVELRGHLPEPARAAFGYGAQDERLAPRRGRDVVADAHVEVRPDPADRLDGPERVTGCARAGEQFAASLLFGVQVQASDRD